MQVAIISDIHDHIANLRKVLEKVQQADLLICCGDLCSPFIIKELGLGYTKDIHIVFGNNDADLFRITTNANKYPNIHLHGELCELEIDEKKFAINHFDDIGRALASSDKYDVVCFGHNHNFEISEQGNTLIVNPGEIMGELTNQVTFVVYDTKLHQAQRIDL